MWRFKRWRDDEMYRAVVIISAGVEWAAVLARMLPLRRFTSPYGRGFVAALRVGGREEGVVFLHGGWGKVDAAASAQYALDRWGPSLLVNLGTCGGFRGVVEPGEIILVERTLIYDLAEQMGDAEAALRHYATELDLSWLEPPYPQPVRRGLMLSADRDIVPSEVPHLRERFGGMVADWESGAIARVAARNGVRCLILRGVSDVVGPEGGEVYDGRLALFAVRAARVMGDLLARLPDWLARALPPI